ncbi:MAG: hypothetical protein ACOX6G_10670 [Christensenellales bacterium]|jgi:hypothetical protein
MKHNLSISVSKSPPVDSLVACRDFSIRERLLRLLFGKKQRITILVPGEMIKEVAICDAEKGEAHGSQTVK